MQQMKNKIFNLKLKLKDAVQSHNRLDAQKIRVEMVRLIKNEIRQDSKRQHHSRDGIL